MDEKRYRIAQIIHDELTLEESTAPEAKTLREIKALTMEQGLGWAAEQQARFEALNKKP